MNDHGASEGWFARPVSGAYIPQAHDHSGLHDIGHSLSVQSERRAPCLTCFAAMPSSIELRTLHSGSAYDVHDVVWQDKLSISSNRFDRGSIVVFR